jgi:hypothetical protein
MDRLFKIKTTPSTAQASLFALLFGAFWNEIIGGRLSSSISVAIIILSLFALIAITFSYGYRSSLGNKRTRGVLSKATTENCDSRYEDLLLLLSMVAFGVVVIVYLYKFVSS